MIIAIDFDGTIVEHAYPEIGPPVPQALDWMKWFQLAGVKLVLWTMRSEGHLEAALQYLRDNGVEVWSANHNPEQTWTTSPKCYADAYIDDMAVGCPLVHPRGGGRPYVDWNVAGPMVAEKLMGPIL